jgi:hypothetical protein
MITGRGQRIESTCSRCGRVRLLRLVLVPISGRALWRPLVICTACEREEKERKTCVRSKSYEPRTNERCNGT